MQLGLNSRGEGEERKNRINVDSKEFFGTFGLTVESAKM